MHLALVGILAMIIVIHHLRGLQVAGHLFGVTVEAADGQAPIWNPDVRFFCIKQESKPVAYFYFVSLCLWLRCGTTVDACSNCFQF